MDDFAPQGKDSDVNNGPDVIKGESNDNRATDASIAAAAATGRKGILAPLLLSVSILGCILGVDYHVWRIIQRPSAAFFLTLPFLLSVTMSAYAGMAAVPLLAAFRARQIVRQEGPPSHRVSKAGTPTMGGLFFVPVALLVTWLIVSFGSSNLSEIKGAMGATLGYWCIGALDDFLSLVRKHNDGLPGQVKFVLQAFVAVAFYWWITGAVLTSPYKDPFLIPLPPPLYWLHPGVWHLPLFILTMLSTVNAVNLTDGVDGLAAGCAAAAFVGMAVAVMPIYPGNHYTPFLRVNVLALSKSWLPLSFPTASLSALGVFGVSFAGACVGFLCHNRPKASVFMGDTGSLAIGGGLAAMAVVSGMYLPLIICSLVFVWETLSVLIQVAYFKLTKMMSGAGRRIFRMSPYHHHLELMGMSEVGIITLGYVVSFLASVLGAHVGLISV